MRNRKYWRKQRRVPNALLPSAHFTLDRDWQIPADLKRWTITAADLDTLVEGAAKVTRLLDNNPRPMGRDDFAPSTRT